MRVLVATALVIVTASLAAVVTTGCSTGSPTEVRAAGLRLEAASHETSAPGASATDTPAATGTLTADAAQKSQVPLKPTLGTDFDVAAAMRHVDSLATGIGPRPGGSEGERRGAAYIADRLREAGYTVRTETVPLPGGLSSANVIAEREGAVSSRFVLGAHYDTKTGVPGANDNATGAAALLVIADILADETPPVTVEFVFFGAEESNDGNPEHHHYGSRFRVAAMSQAQRTSTVGMLSVDMIGYGSSLTVRTMRRGPQTLSDDFIAFTRERDVPAGFKLDAGASGWSDHEAYELAGIPAAWVEWRDDPVYHTAGDTPPHIKQEKVEVVGQVVLDYVRALDSNRVERLR